MFPSGGTPVLAAAPLNWGSFGAESNTFPRSRARGITTRPLFAIQVAAIPMHNAPFGPKAPLTQPAVIQKWSIWWWWWVVVGHEPVHDSLHVTYRLLAPGTEPSRGPQPITIFRTYILKFVLKVQYLKLKV